MYFTLNADLEFWPYVPWRKGTRVGGEVVPAGTIVVGITLPDKVNQPGPTQTAVEVAEGPHKGRQRYATTRIDIVECSPLKLLARQAKD